MSATVRYRKQWEDEFTHAQGGKQAFEGLAKEIGKKTQSNLRAGGLAGDPPAQEYYDDIQTEPTTNGARVFTTASRAHLVEWGTIYRAPDAAMRAAARTFGRFVEGTK